MELKPTYFGTMLSLATVAFGLLAAGAWNAAIKDIVALFLPAGSGVVAEIIYAVLITILAIFVTAQLAKLADRASGGTKS